jgi:sugar/nucleoside kinase (ribokinase family)
VRSIEVLCIGQVVADIIARPLSTFHFSKDTTLVDSIEISNGGDAFNTAVDMRKLGVKAALAGKVGNDALGRMLLKKAKGFGIPLKGIRVSSTEKTSACIALVNRSGERVFIYFGGANEKFFRGDLDEALFRRARIVHFGGVFDTPGIEGAVLAEILRDARTDGIITSMDVTWDNEGIWLPKIREALPYLDYFLPSINEVKEMLGTSDPVKAASELLAMGVRNVAVKLGADGCYIASAEVKMHVPGFPPSKVVDTTGAGDAFVAGFIAGVVKKWTLRECARLGNAVGALAVQKAGATEGVTGFPDAAQLMSRKGAHDGT